MYLLKRCFLTHSLGFQSQEESVELELLSLSDDENGLMSILLSLLQVATKASQHVDLLLNYALSLNRLYARTRDL